MNIFDEIEQLINERGSSAKLKEHLLHLKDQHAVFVNESIAHKTKIAELGTEVRQLENKITRLHEVIEKLEIENNQLRNQLDILHSSNPDGHVCDHCGSENLKRTGSKPNKTFGDLGVKDAIFQCDDCSKETAVTIDPQKQIRS